MMQTEEIPREQWPRFFDLFSRQHEGWLATLEIFDTQFGAQPEAEELVFEGISLDSDSGESDSVIINLGRTPDAHITHTIYQPTNLWVQQTSEGANASLEVKAEDNSNTLLRFRSPMLPEFVDGIAG